MAWSTRRLAELAGTTVKTVRHYHAIGLLEEPARAGNGYKEYGTSHLVRLLQIARLRELGMPLSGIAELEESGEAFTQTLRTLDSQLAASIAHQQELRAEIADLLRHCPDPDVPAGFADVADDLTPADRAMVMISARVYDEQGLQDMRAIVAHHREADDAFDELASDATADEIRAVAARLAPALRTIHEQYPGTRTPPLGVGSRTSLQDLVQAVTELYNPAQVEVLRQAYRLAL
ncbi:MerR family transcriptional regulator [Streptomonospora alba]|uniref:MerR family transcriptional regulator n=1 Tax=Streptomonospora alba TaxID=183763 RepID=A0A0C2FFR2_9ACTN|nr:MerR family transcriptional regulator [Streptomonospora alba]KIH98084.1 MerR family transcriptional regulator [Streptomonospora alba]